MENLETRPVVPGWFMIVSVLAVFWQLVGVAAYMMSVTATPAELAALPEAQRTLTEATPPWVTAAFATAVFAGALGAIAMLFRLKWSRMLLWLSLIAALVQFGWMFGVARAHETIGPQAAGLPAAVILIGALLVWLASMGTRRGWLR